MNRFLKCFSLFMILAVCSTVKAGDHKSTGMDSDILDARSGYVNQALSSASVDTGFSGDVLTLGTFGTDLIVGGKFGKAGGVSSIRVAGWNGSAWYAMNGLPFGPEVYSVIEFNGELLAGTFLQTVYKWTGATWTAFGPDLGPNLNFGRVHAMELYNGSLYVAGHFSLSSTQPPYIAKWNGAAWDSVGTVIRGKLECLTLFNGSLVAAGKSFGSWNDTDWTELGFVNATAGNLSPIVFAMTEYNGNLIAGGHFEKVGGNNALNIATWNGVTWQKLGSGFNDKVHALIVDGIWLYAAGAFTMSGGTTVNYVGQWNGGGWDPIGALDSTVYALHIYNGKLVAAGSFQTVGGGHVAWWDGVNWRPMSDIPVGVGNDLEGQRPTDFSLGQNYPNPFNPSTAIEFSLSQPSMTQVDIFNINGQFVAQLVNRPLTAGAHKVVWDGKNSLQQDVSSGVYFYRLTTNRQTVSKKMILMK